jgi:hypothetical protein
VLAGLAIAVVIVLAGLVGARLVRKKADTVPPQPGNGTELTATDA